MKYILEIKPEYEANGIMILGARDSHLYVTTLEVKDLEELNSDYINEHFGDLQDEAYQRGYKDCETRYCSFDACPNRQVEYKRGLEDAWECARELYLNGACKDLFGEYFNTFIKNHTAQEAIAKLKSYEEKQKEEDEIKVGDEVQHGDSTGIVYDAGDLIISGLLTDDGPFVPFQWYKQECKKTGRHFYWRMGDYALQAVPKCLARFDKDDENETIELVKYYQYRGEECLYTIGYFYYDEHEPCWKLKFVGDRFKELLETDVVAVFKMLKAAYDVLTEWMEGREVTE